MTAAGVLHRRAQSGQGMVEYALILTLVALVVIVMLLTTGKQVTNLFSDITNSLSHDAGL
jgi:pilus assembly protein Flp/PilA